MYFWVGNVVLLWDDVTRHFWDMLAQQVHFWVPQGIELPVSGLVLSMVMGLIEIGGFENCFSLALTSFFARLSLLLRQRHGLGIRFLSSCFGLRMLLMALTSRSGVYLILRNVSNFCTLVSFFVRRLILFEKGTWRRLVFSICDGYPLSDSAFTSLSVTLL